MQNERYQVSAPHYLTKIVFGLNVNYSIEQLAGWVDRGFIDQSWSRTNYYLSGSIIVRKEA